MLSKEVTRKEQSLNMLRYRVELNRRGDILMSESKKNEILECNSSFSYLENNEGVRTLINSYTCKDRYCANCNKRKSYRESELLSSIIYTLENDYLEKREYLFLTLTIPNVSGDELNNAIKKLNEGYHRMIKYKAFNFVKGWVRKTESTYNRLHNTYHPHLHVILSVKPYYFKSKYYLSYEKILKLWQRAMKDKSITNIDIRRCKRDSEGKSTVVKEMSKYFTKPIDYTNDIDVFKCFYRGFKRIRLSSFGGEFKKIKKEVEARKNKESIDCSTFTYYIKKSYNIHKNEYEEQRKNINELTDVEMVNIISSLRMQDKI